MKLTADQQCFLDAIQAGENVFLTGKAGTGKSFVTKRAIRNLRNDGKRVIALAPTGVAADHIQGQTIHSLYSLEVFGLLTYDTCKYLKKEKRELLRRVDTIVIDEISMLRPDVLDAIHFTMVKNECGGLYDKQLIFIGDMKQLLASVDKRMRSLFYKHYKSEAFTDAKIFSALNVREIELNEVLRQSDEEFIESLNIIRNGGKSPYFSRFVADEPRGIVLAPYNKIVKKYNDEGLSSINKPPIVFEARLIGEVKLADFNLEAKVVLKDGCRVMYLANSQTTKLVNGTQGVFKVVGEDYFIRVGNKDFPLERHEFKKKAYRLSADGGGVELVDIGSIVQYPVKLAYALTIHKSQGLTFDEVTVDLTSPCFMKGQLYTALSRVRTPAGLTIIVGERRRLRSDEPCDPALMQLLAIAKKNGYPASWAHSIYNEHQQKSDNEKVCSS